MVLIDALLLPVFLFFLFLPITDRRTVMMRLGMMAVIAGLLVGSVTRAHGPSLVAHLPQTVAMSGN